MKVRTSMILLALLCAANAYGGEPAQDQTREQAKEPKTVKITISPETTYVTEPLLPDGRVDYYGALNRLLSDGVTPENNIFAGVFTLVTGEYENSLLRARYEEADEDQCASLIKFREKYYQMLGFSSPPELDSLAFLDPPGAFISAKVNPYEELLRFYPKEEIDAKIESRKKEEAENYRNQHKEGKIDDAQLAEKLKGLDTDAFRNEESRDMICHEFYYDAMERVFTEDEYPLVADWMKSSTGLANQLIEISKRPKSYNPQVKITDDATIYDAPLPYVQMMRQVARYFQTRGNWHFGRGEYDEAMECAFATFRLAMTMRSNAGFVVEELVAIAMQGIAHHQIVDYLGLLDGKKDAAWILAKQREYRAICRQAENAPNPPHWIMGERLGLLSLITTTASHPEYPREYLTANNFWLPNGEEQFEQELALLDKCYDPDYEYDWDKIMKRVNYYWEDKEDLMLLPGLERRARAYERLDERIGEKARFIMKTEITPETDRDQLFADFLYSSFSPALSAALYAMTRIQCLEVMSDVAFSVATYRADQGGYPETLDQLVPKYLDRVPVSPYTNKPLRYMKRAHDVLLVNDETFLLDGSEERVEKMIAEVPGGASVFPLVRSFLIILHKD